jgi:tripartite-type tricarboxylate transporter receptor subunit TctC
MRRRDLDDPEGKVRFAAFQQETMWGIMRRRRFLRLTASAAIAGLVARFPNAAAQLAKQIRIVVPFPPGGATDIVARPLAQMLGEANKALVIVDNRGGAGGTIGADAVAKSLPDGQTLLMATVGTHAINPSLYKKLPYDAVKDFTPIALVAVAPVAMVVNPALPVGNLADLVAMAKQKPGKLNYGSAGVGTPGHLTGEMFKTTAGINIQHVPYKGGAPALTDLIAGQIDIMFEPLQSALSNVQAGKIRALALSSKTRSSVLPDVPTIAESGYDGFETTAWWAVFGPANLPAAMTARLADELKRIVSSNSFRGTLEPLGVIPTALAGSEFVEFHHAEMIKWGKAAHDSGASFD